MSQFVLSSAAASTNRSTALQLWLIGSLAPLALILNAPLQRSDFISLWLAGKMAIAGAAGQIYDTALSGVFASQLGLHEATNFPYPPNALLFFAPFASIPPVAAYFAWNLATAAFFVWAARPYLPRDFPPILVILTPAALTCLDFGQTGLIFGGLWLLAFQGRWPAVALMAFKPHLALLGILSLQDRRSLTKAILFGLILLGVPAILWGPSLWADFFHHTVDHAGEMGTRKRWLFAGVTPAIGYGIVGWIPFAVAGGLLLARNINAFTAATASFLISPYGFHYDMTVACLGFGLMIFNSWRDMPIRHRIPMALGFLSPVIALIGVWWVPPILMWVLWVQSKYPGIRGSDGSNSATMPAEAGPMPAVDDPENGHLVRDEPDEQSSSKIPQ